MKHTSSAVNEHEVNGTNLSTRASTGTIIVTGVLYIAGILNIAETNHSLHQNDDDKHAQRFLHIGK